VQRLFWLEIAKGLVPVHAATLAWVHWWNHQRLHPAIEYQTPIEYEQEYYREHQPRQQPQSGELAVH